MVDITQKLKDTTITASILINTGLTPVYNFTLTAGSDAATLSLYDNTSAAGTPVIVLSAIKNATLPIDWSVVGPRMFRTDLYVALTGTGSSAHLWYA